MRSNGKSNVVWLIVVVGTTAVAFAIDRLLWPDHADIALYMIPVLLASLRWFPSAVLTVTICMLLVALLDLYLESHATSQDVASLAALLAVGVIGSLHALHREELREKTERQQTVIATVERMRQPLTVILGYASLLRAKSQGQETASAGLSAIQRAAIRLRELLDEVMARWGLS